MRQTRDIDALTEDRIVEQHEVLVRIKTPGVESVEELVTCYLLTVNNSTILDVMLMTL